MAKMRIQDENFESRVRGSFAKQGFMKTIGARLTEVSPGKVEIELPVHDGLTQQHGFVHAGVVTAIVDTACGYAAMTLMPVDAEVLSVEYKVNFLSPAAGAQLIARGRVVKPGRTVTVCQGDVFARKDENEKIISTILCTMIAVQTTHTER